MIGSRMEGGDSQLSHDFGVGVFDAEQTVENTTNSLATTVRELVDHPLEEQDAFVGQILLNQCRVCRGVLSGSISGSGRLPRTSPSLLSFSISVVVASGILGWLMSYVPLMSYTPDPIAVLSLSHI